MLLSALPHRPFSQPSPSPCAGTSEPNPFRTLPEENQTNITGDTSKFNLKLLPLNPPPFPCA